MTTKPEYGYGREVATLAREIEFVNPIDEEPGVIGLFAAELFRALPIQALKGISQGDVLYPPLWTDILEALGHTNDRGGPRRRREDDSGAN